MSDLTPHQAIIHLMVTMSAADQMMSNAELATVGEIIKLSPFFEGYDTANMVDDVKACADLLETEDGVDQVIENAKKALPARYHETAYAFAVEVAAADLVANQEELRFLQMLRDELPLDRLIASAIERGARARYARLKA